MRATATKLDYVGFTFNGLHSSQFGILSVTSGNRYAQDLLPSSQDVSANIEGGDGSYYFGSNLKERTFSLNLAFDSVTELEFREMGAWLHNNNNIGILIFDEKPYIKYYAKLKGAVPMKYLTFEENNVKRVYKGEATISFTSYDVYGYSVYNFLNSYTDVNKDEWAGASQMLVSNVLLGQPYYDLYKSGALRVYNPGDVPADYIITLTIDDNVTPVLTLGSSTMTINCSNLLTGTVTIDSNKRLIKYNGEIFNYLLTNGNFFKIPKSALLNGADSTLVDVSTPLTITNVLNASITYSYKFL